MAKKKLDASIPKGGWKSLKDLHKYNVKRGMNVSSGMIGFGGKKKKGGCFITTAVCKTLQKPDNCVELMKFRHFRDTFMRKSPKMCAEVEEYYEIAPKICVAIDQSGDEIATKKYALIWEKSLKPAFEALDKGDDEKTYVLYKNMVMELKNEYL
jgi:hypothetical protein